MFLAQETMSKGSKDKTSPACYKVNKATILVVWRKYFLEVNWCSGARYTEPCQPEWGIQTLFWVPQESSRRTGTKSGRSVEIVDGERWINREKWVCARIIFFLKIFYSLIHMCIHCLGHFSPLLPCALPLPSPPAYRQNVFCSFLQFCWRGNISNNKRDNVILLVKMKIAIQRDS
jgi:hypothetical protein